MSALLWRRLRKFWINRDKNFVKSLTLYYISYIILHTGSFFFAGEGSGNCIVFHIAQPSGELRAV